MSLLLVLMCVRLVGAFVPLQAPRGVVSFELDGVLFDARAVRDGVRGELQPWLASQLSATPPDAQEMMDAVRAAGAEFGMMMPGVRAIQREATKKTIASAGADEDAGSLQTNDIIAQPGTVESPDASTSSPPSGAM